MSSIQIRMQGLLNGANGKKDAVETGAAVYTGAFEKGDAELPESALRVYVDKRGKVWGVYAGDTALAFNATVIPPEVGPTYQAPYAAQRQLFLTGKLTGMRAKGRR